MGFKLNIIRKGVADFSASEIFLLRLMALPQRADNRSRRESYYAEGGEM
jgi:hypothetical protein